MQADLESIKLMYGQNSSQYINATKECREEERRVSRQFVFATELPGSGFYKIARQKMIFYEPAHYPLRS